METDATGTEAIGTTAGGNLSQRDSSSNTIYPRRVRSFWTWGVARPTANITGCDISAHAIAEAQPEIRHSLFQQRAETAYPFDDDAFDLVLSIGVLHNLIMPDLKAALGEIERVGKQKYVLVESYRNEEELFNLQCWALTCESFHRPEAWTWIFREFGYTGDYEFIYFES